MTKTVAFRKNKLKGVDTENLNDKPFNVTIMPISEEEADEIEFKSLKGIASKPLNVDEIRRERLGL